MSSPPSTPQALAWPTATGVVPWATPRKRTRKSRPAPLAPRPRSTRPAATATSPGRVRPSAKNTTLLPPCAKKSPTVPSTNSTTLGSNVRCSGASNTAWLDEAITSTVMIAPGAISAAEAITESCSRPGADVRGLLRLRSVARSRGRRLDGACTRAGAATGDGPAGRLATAACCGAKTYTDSVAPGAFASGALPMTRGAGTSAAAGDEASGVPDSPGTTTPGSASGGWDGGFAGELFGAAVGVSTLCAAQPPKITAAPSVRAKCAFIVTGTRSPCRSRS